ncbi:hypothetical protein [Pseudomonas gingeri]|uniref:hypothetical protein n=1 Tax=Pseudomonas gingeri TaxID=117681 RepID=UPI00210C5078|nr:hypothetical protein [Pseudomonas gingeri]
MFEHIDFTYLLATYGCWAGEFLEQMLGNLKPYRLPIIIGVVLLMAGIALIRHLRGQHEARQSDAKLPDHPPQ